MRVRIEHSLEFLEEARILIWRRGGRGRLSYNLCNNQMLFSMEQPQQQQSSQTHRQVNEMRHNRSGNLVKYSRTWSEPAWHLLESHDVLKQVSSCSRTMLHFGLFDQFWEWSGQLRVRTQDKSKPLGKADYLRCKKLLKKHHFNQQSLLEKVKLSQQFSAPSQTQMRQNSPCHWQQVVRVVKKLCHQNNLLN